MTADQARSVLITHKEAHKAALQEAIRRNPGGKLAKRIGAKWLDYSLLEDKVQEWGGDEGAIFFICAQVAERVPLVEVCRHYVLDYGLVWAWITADKDRYSRYQLALQGVADGFVGEVVDIADEQAEVITAQGNKFDPDVARDKLRIDARLKVAAKYAKAIYGEKQDPQTAVAVSVILNSQDAHVL